jgi:hypothetical protein
VDIGISLVGFVFLIEFNGFLNGEFFGLYSDKSKMMFGEHPVIVGMQGLHCGSVKLRMM